ncbi:MAG: glycosyltransferase [Nanoarchaeota archaeon]
MKKEHPLVSFIIPAYNEEQHIGRVIDSLEAQTYPKERIQIIIADGRSTDRTADIVKERQKKNPNIILLKNPSRNTAIGRNICLKEAKGTYIFNYSGHAIAKENFVSTVVSKLEQNPNKVMGVGVASNPPDEELTFTGQCIQTVFSTLFGGGGITDQNINLKKEKEVRSIAFTAYRRELFGIIGNFDEHLWCGQDGEFNLRLNNAGYKLLFIPYTSVSLQKKESPSRFFKQMYAYGLGAAIRIKKHPKSFKLYYIIPSIGTVLLALLVLASIVSRDASTLLGELILLYIIIGFIWAFTRSRTLLISICAPFFYFIIHAAYGIGYLDGMISGKFRR